MIIYKITNLLNGKIYIGKSKENDPKYLGSGKIISRAIVKYGKENFKKDIIKEYSVYNKELLNKREKFYIKKFRSLHPLGYNIMKGGEGGDTFTNNPNLNIIRKKISNALKISMLGNKNGINNFKKINHFLCIKAQSPFSKIKRINTFKKIKHQMGSKNSNYGKVWCVKKNAKNCLNRKPYKLNEIPNGWITCSIWKDRKKVKNHIYGKHWYNNGLKNFLLNDNLSLNLLRGRM